MKGGRFPQLDGLRAAAILMVVLYHTSHGEAGPRNLFGRFLSTGWNGVNLFFVLSGFLVGGLAFKELAATGTILIPRFWIRRFLRTWPLYLILLALEAYRQSPFPPQFWRYLTFTQNLADPQLKFFSPTWSLAVEEQFYFVFPTLLWALARMKKLHFVPFLLLLGMIFSGLFRLWCYLPRHTFSVMDSLLAGIAISYLYQHRPRVLDPIRRHPNLGFLAGLAFVYLPFFWDSPGIGHTLACSGLALGFGLVLISCLDTEMLLSQILASRPARFIALVSYSIYLSQGRPLFYVAKLAESLQLQGWPRFTFVVTGGAAAAVTVGTLLYYAIEAPGMRFRDRLFPRA